MLLQLYTLVAIAAYCSMWQVAMALHLGGAGYQRVWIHLEGHASVDRSSSCSSCLTAVEDSLQGRRRWKPTLYCNSSWYLQGLPFTDMCCTIVQLTLPSKPEQAWFLDQEERCWLQQRQEQHRQAALSANPHAGSYLGKNCHVLLIKLYIWKLFHGCRTIPALHFALGR